MDPIVLALRQAATQLDTTPARVALAWTLGRSAIASITIGARSETLLADNLTAATLVLPDDVRRHLDTISASALSYPFWMQQFHDTGRVVP